MGKGIKNLLKKAIKTAVGTISTLLVLLITLPLLASLLINIPVVQNAVVRRVMASLSESLGTTVSIDRIHLKLVSRVVVDGFYVEDFQGDTLLYAKRLTAPIVELGIVGEPLTFGRVKLEKTEMWLRRDDSTGTINIKHLVNAMRGEDYEKNPASNFRMKIMGIEADSLTFGLLRYDKPFRDDGVDFSRFIIRNTKVDIDNFSIVRDTIRIGIRSLSFYERSGFHVNDMSAHELVVSEGLVSLNNVRVKSTGADLDIPSIRLQGEDWSSFRDFTDSVSVDVAIRDSRLSTDFLGWFVPAVAKWGVTLDGISLETRGPVAAISGSIARAQTLGSSFALDFTSRGLPDFKNMRLDADIHSIATNGGDIDSLMRAVTGKSLPESVAGPVKRLGECVFSGKFKGGFDDFNAGGTLVSEAGEVRVEASVATRRGGSAVDGRVSVPRLDLGRLLAVKDLGTLSGDFSLNGKLEKGGHVSGEIGGGINILEFRKYAYRGIELDGRLDDKMFDGTVHSRDPGLDFDFLGMLDFNDSIPKYNFALDLRGADLASTGLNRTDSVSMLSGKLTALASGNDFDNLNGLVEIRDAVYISSVDTVRTDLIAVTGRNSEVSKYISLASEFADVKFHSRVSYRDMFAYMGDFLREYVPMLYHDDIEKPLPAHERNIAAAASYSILTLHVKNTDKLFDALMPGTHIAEDTEVSFMFNPFVRNFSFSAKSEFLEYRNMLAANVKLNSDNNLDSLTLHLSSEDFYSGSLHIPDLALHGGSRGRQATLSTRFTDATGNFSALLGLRIDTEQAGGNRSLRFRFTPSYVSLDQQKWYIGATSVIYDTTRIAVNNLRVWSEGNPIEQLTVNGVASRAPSDTLHIRLNDFDLSPLGRIAESRGYRLAGHASGYIDFMSLLKGTRMNAGIDFSGLSLNGREAAPLRFTSFWDRTNERVRFQMLNQRNNVNVLRGAFSPSAGTIDAVAAISALDVGLLDPIIGGILENTKGTADFNIELDGTLKKLRMNGRVDIPRFETTIGFTKATYTIENAVINVEDSRLRLPSTTTVRDPLGNTAQFGMTVDLSNFKNIGVDINAAVHNFMAVNTEPDDNEAFYGQVFASGSLGIKVDKMGTKMGISATTGRGTKFHLPLNAKSNISWADFVVLADPNLKNIDSTNVLARKKLIYERQLQGQAGTKRRKPLDMDITVDLTPDAEFHLLIDPNLGHGINAHGRGVINMRINPTTNLFSMVGDVTVSDGRFDFSMMDVFNKEFTITPGSTLIWTGAPEDALLNVEAVYRLRTSLSPLIGESSSWISGGSAVPVDCIIRLTERLSQPEITFDVRLSSGDPDAQLIVSNAMNSQELKSTQFLSLLMTGGFASNNSITGQSANSGAMASGAVGFDILTSQLSNFLSSEDYNIYFKYRPQTDYSGNQYDVGFSTAFIDNRLVLEIEGNYVDDRAATSVGTSNVSNLAGDVSLTWSVDKSGNIRLKVFSQTIDRLNETQGLQESGLGIYLKKDFDSFRNIWRKNQDSFANFGSDSVVTKKTKRKNKQ